jgi:peptide/nickel transport system permease protein
MLALAESISRRESNPIRIPAEKRRLPSSTLDQGLSTKQRSQTATIWRSFIRSKPAVVSLVYLVVLVAVAILAPLLTSYDPNQIDTPNRIAPMSNEHLLGTDHLGRDILARIIYGTRISLTVGLLTAFLGSATIGTAVGLIAGYYGGRIDNIIMRVIDIMMAFPGVLLAILIMATLGQGLFNMMIALSIFSIPAVARVTRGSTLAQKERDFILAAHCMGLSHTRIMFRHILPNCMAPIIVMSTLRVATVILAAASLSFIGLGAKPPTPEWGAMINDGRWYLRQAPQLMIVPGIAILITVLSINFVGDALRDAMDPHLRIR